MRMQQTVVCGIRMFAGLRELRRSEAILGCHTNGNIGCSRRQSAERKTMADHERTKMRSEKEFKSLMTRLKKIEGQIRGIEGMLEKNAYCPDILIQVSAVSSALASFNKELLGNHIRSCVAEDIRQGNDETIEELVKVLQKLMK